MNQNGVKISDSHLGVCSGFELGTRPTSILLFLYRLFFLIISSVMISLPAFLASPKIFYATKQIKVKFINYYTKFLAEKKKTIK